MAMCADTGKASLQGLESRSKVMAVEEQTFIGRQDPQSLCSDFCGSVDFESLCCILIRVYEKNVILRKISKGNIWLISSLSLKQLNV